MSNTAEDRDSGWYEIRVQGHLDQRWAALLEPLAVTTCTDGTTRLRGRVPDQAALHGLLQRLRDTGLPLVSVTRTDSDPR